MDHLIRASPWPLDWGCCPFQRTKINKCCCYLNEHGEGWQAATVHVMSNACIIKYAMSAIVKFSLRQILDLVPRWMWCMSCLWHPFRWGESWFRELRVLCVSCKALRGTLMHKKNMKNQSVVNSVNSVNSSLHSRNADMNLNTKVVL